jgi:transcription elongation GreA/GreB family factor
MAVALLRKSEGDEITVVIPGGSSAVYAITGIRYDTIT